uniref:AAA domain-containing protein n=1 Tax=Trichuris muris TaxID=70415 RepID=A0A5S6QJ78_TRIMR
MVSTYNGLLTFAQSPLFLKCVQSLADSIAAFSIPAVFFHRRKAVARSASSLSQKERFTFLGVGKKQKTPLHSWLIGLRNAKSDLVHTFRLQKVKDVSETRSLLKGCLFRVEDVTLNLTSNEVYCLPRRNFKLRRLPKSTSRSSVFVSGKETGRKSGVLWWLSTILPWRSSGKRLEKLLEKAESENAKLLVKSAFTEGYVASGGITKKFLFFAFLLLLLPSLLQLYLHYGVISDQLFSSVKEITPEEINVNFDDVKGIDEAKEELMQIVDYLKQPEKYCKLGGRLPKGVLLVGPPGIGKTLLARAIAGEAGVAFFHTSGSEFEEMFVGLGAKRIRDLFEAARERAPCVLFIDEIDSVGSRRTEQSVLAYSNQTLNQLLSEMDGFESTEGVIVLAATNRREDLDQALLRPGRFDLQLVLGYPDLKGRMDIFNLYLSRVKTDGKIDVETMAKGTIGFSGADIENLVNQAALKAAADNKEYVDMEYLEYAKDLVLMGPALKHRVPDEAANRVTAYHEAGHALVSYFTKHAHPVHRVTILPRREALGLTSFMPEKDQYEFTRAQMLASLDVMMAGRAAEDLICGYDLVSSGCATDLSKATDLALDMVQRYGMSDKIGFRIVKDADNTLLGYSRDVSSATAQIIDNEVKSILQDAYERAKTILKNNAAAHKRVAEALLKHETLNADELKAIIEKQPWPESTKTLKLRMMNLHHTASPLK